MAASVTWVTIIFQWKKYVTLPFNCLRNRFLYTLKKLSVHQIHYMPKCLSCHKAILSCHKDILVVKPSMQSKGTTLSAVLRKLSKLFRNGQVIQILFLTVPKQTLLSYQLKEENINVKCKNITLERVSKWKLFGITLDEHFHLDKHISK